MEVQRPSVLPLAAIEVHDSECTPSEASSAPSSPRITSTPVPQELDATNSAPHASTRNISSAFAQTLGSKSWDMRRFQLIAANISMVTIGWHDACAGPLLPYIQAHYHITYSVVSLLFVGQCVGFVVASFSNTYLSDRLGLGKVLALGALFQISGYTLIIPSLPFPVFIVAYMFSGFGLALQDAQANTYIASLPNSTSKLGWLHAFYGLGALLSPLLATAFAESGIRYNLYYLVLIGISVINTLCILGAFRLQREPLGENTTEQNTLTDEGVPRNSQNDQDIEMHNVETLQTTGTAETVIEEEKFNSSSKKLKTILSQRITVISSIFLVIYVGAEVSIGGWIVSYLLHQRNGGTSAGYVSSGFFAGITLGRVLLIKVNSLVGEKRVIWLYTAICVGLELVVWLAPNFIADAVAVSLVGFFMGPYYPIVMSLMTKILPRSLHAGAIGFAAALGQTGSAIFPFITGTMAQRLGVGVLHPILLVLFGVMSVLWIFMPTPQRRRE